MSSLIDLFMATGHELDAAGKMQQKPRHLGECDAEYRRRLIKADSSDDGGPAFGDFKQAGELSIKTGGVTVRDYFAAKALAGLLGDTAQRNGTTSALAETAYMIADAMIQERSK